MREQDHPFEHVYRLPQSGRAGTENFYRKSLLSLRDDIKSLTNMSVQGFITNLIQFNADPSGASDIGRPVVGVRLFRDQCFLQTRRSRHQRGDVSVVVMIIRENREHTLL